MQGGQPVPHAIRPPPEAAASRESDFVKLETDDFLTSHAAPAPAGQAAVQDQIPEDRLYTYVIVRGDLEMAPGKTASQAVHAARLSLLRYIKDHPDRADEFISKNSCGSVVVLVAKNLMQLEEAHARAVAEGLPAALFVDSGHIPVVWLPAEQAKRADATVQASACGTANGEPIQAPTYLPSETRRCLNKHFLGGPVVTALAIGPACRGAMRHITKRFRCV